MIIDDKLILKLERLARLKLSEQERVEIKADLSKILIMIQKLEEIDTDGVEPLVYVTSDENRPAEDVVGNQVTKDQALSNAPSKDSDFFKVPKVIQSNT